VHILKSFLGVWLGESGGMEGGGDGRERLVQRYCCFFAPLEN